MADNSIVLYIHISFQSINPSHQTKFCLPMPSDGLYDNSFICTIFRDEIEQLLEDQILKVENVFTFLQLKIVAEPYLALQNQMQPKTISIKILI